jgi:hypothetical protein
MGASAQRWAVIHSHATITSPGSAPDRVCRRQSSDGWEAFATNLLRALESRLAASGPSTRWRFDGDGLVRLLQEEMPVPGVIRWRRGRGILR